ncbi:MAG: DUF3566 domain-containing protein [Actinobacteria bacterium]|nr:DUF3566 domain-containing protein [Actinomycetota bacterium]
MIRRIDPWSVLKVSIVFYLSLVLVFLLAGVLLWTAGSIVGAVEGVEKLISGFGFQGFEFVGSQLLRGFVAAGLVIVVLGTGMSVVVAVLYNLISDLVGGIELSVLEENLRAVPAPAHEAGERAARAEEQALAPGYPA